MGSRTFAGALVDLDGTVYLGDSPIPGARGAIETLRDDGVAVLFLTNKAIERRSDYSEKLTNLGIPTSPEEVVNSSAITSAYLRNNHASDPVFVVGEEPLCQELRESGLELTHDPAETAVILASMDRHLDYETLTTALHAMDDDTAFLATNPDRTCPTQAGEIPDCGAMVGAIEGATGRELDQVLGKPAQTTIDAATRMVGVAPERCLMIGDRLETDVRMGNRAGMTTVLVLSEVTDRETLNGSSIQPDHVIDSLADFDSVLYS